MFLQVGLGLISLCQRFEELVAAQGTPLLTSQEVARDPSYPPASEKRLVAEGAQALGARADEPPVLRLQMSGQSPSDAAPATEDSPFLHFVLGIAAFSQQLLLHAEKASVAAVQVERREGGRPYPIRRLLT